MRKNAALSRRAPGATGLEKSFSRRDKNFAECREVFLQSVCKRAVLNSYTRFAANKRPSQPSTSTSWGNFLEWRLLCLSLEFPINLKKLDSMLLPLLSESPRVLESHVLPGGEHQESTSSLQKK